MDTIHDLGGKQGFGSIPYRDETDAKLFNEPWKARIWAIAMMTMNKLSQEETGWSLDWYRHVLERLPPDLYLRLDYFEKWTLALMVTAIDEGIAERADFVEGRARPGTWTPKRQPQAQEGGDGSGRFKAGDKVIAKRDVASMHTRLPSYIRGRSGVIASVIGPQPLADRSASGVQRIEPSYVVEFAMLDLWPEATQSRDVVRIDMWESYLDAA